MQQPPQMPDFDHLERLLDSIALEVGASELHGVVCGLLCGGLDDARPDWFDELFEELPKDDLLVREARGLVDQLYLATRRKVRDEDLDFKPFLPAAGTLLAKRARALSEWCQGFLYGLALAGVKLAELEVDARESVGDITEFTRLDYEAIRPGDESEADYMEIEEFLRVAVWVILEAAREQREAADAGQ